MKYSIIVPTLNERENIIRLIRQLESLAIPELEILVADENSEDGTATAVNEYAQDKPYIRAILNDGQPGLSPSIVKGFSHATGDYLCCMDGDLQHNPADAIEMLRDAEARNLDMMIGSRYSAGGGFAEKWSWSRTLISRTAAAMSWLFLQVNLSDPMSGFFVIRREVFNREKHLLNPAGFKIMLELYFVITNCSRHYCCGERGIVFGLRQFGKSKLTLRIIFQYLRQLWRLRQSRSKIRQD